MQYILPLLVSVVLASPRPWGVPTANPEVTVTTEYGGFPSPTTEPTPSPTNGGWGVPSSSAGSVPSTEPKGP
jgi:hypothetical protein